AAPSPRANVSVSSIPGEGLLIRVNTPSRAAATNIQPCVHSNKRRRSTTSASAPAGSAAKNTGRLEMACISATRAEEDVSDVMSHAAPTFCIQVPIFDRTLASQSARKNGCWSGLQAELSSGGSSAGGDITLAGPPPSAFVSAQLRVTLAAQPACGRPCDLSLASSCPFLVL